jgi:rubrerythrin
MTGEPVFVCPSCFHRANDYRETDGDCPLCGSPYFQKQRCQRCGDTFLDPYEEAHCPSCRGDIYLQGLDENGLKQYEEDLNRINRLFVRGAP